MLVKTYIDKAMLVPDHVMTRLMLSKLEQLSGHSWLLDGKTSNAFVTVLLFLYLLHSKDAQSKTRIVYPCLHALP